MWEISFDELDVYESQPLGKGQFGEVFRGLLRGQLARKRSSVRGKNKSPKYSMTHIVAVKKLKSKHVFFNTQCMALSVRFALHTLYMTVERNIAHKILS